MSFFGARWTFLDSSDGDVVSVHVAMHGDGAEVIFFECADVTRFGIDDVNLTRLHGHSRRARQMLRLRRPREYIKAID